MNKAIILVVFFTLVFGTALFLKPDLSGADTYYYYAFSCGHVSSLEGKGIIAETIFHLLPCNQTIWKLVQIGIIFSTSILIGMIGFQVFGKAGWWAAPLSWMSLILVGTYSSLEPLQIGFLYSLLSLFFLLSKIKWNWFFSLVFIGISGLIWKGAILFFFGLSLIYFPFLVLTIPLIVFNLREVVFAVLPNFQVYEQLPIYSLAGFPIPILLFCVLFFWSFKIYFEHKDFWKLKTWFNLDFEPKLFYATVFFLLLASFGFKWALLLLPFAAIQLTKTFIGSQRIEKAYIISILSVFVLAVIFLIPNGIPTRSQEEGVEKVLSFSTDKNIQNDWSYGHWILAKGGFPSREFGASSTDGNFVCDQRSILTESDLNSEYGLLWKNRVLRVYYCLKGGFVDE